MKKFENFGSDEEDRIKELEDAIIKRNELIYVMMHNLSHNYQAFMVRPTNIDDLYKSFKVDEMDLSRKFIQRKLDQLGEDVF